MKKIILTIAVVGIIGFASSCTKCNTCTDSNLNELNHDYCNDVYRNATAMDAAKAACEERGGTWSAITK